MSIVRSFALNSATPGADNALQLDITRNTRLLYIHMSVWMIMTASGNANASFGLSTVANGQTASVDPLGPLFVGVVTALSAGAANISDATQFAVPTDIALVGGQRLFINTEYFSNCSNLLFRVNLQFST